MSGLFPARLLRVFSVAVIALGLSSCADRVHHLVVSVPEQRMAVYKEKQLLTSFPVSTSRFGLGDTPGSNATPLGQFKIAKKIGEGQPSGMKFKNRKPTGEIVPPNAPGRDPIVSRILWLKGLEAQNRHAYKRYIYIHGTPEETRLGTPASYGCVRLASRDVIWLFDQVGKGARLDIVTTPLAESWPYR